MPGKNRGSIPANCILEEVGVMKTAGKVLCLIISFVMIIMTVPGGRASAEEKWYEVADDKWMGFDAETQTITWYPDVFEEVVLPDKIDGVEVKRIGEWAFSNHEKLKTVTIPDTVEVLDEGAFYKCPNLTTVKGFRKVRSIGNTAFYNCGNLRTIENFGSVSGMGNNVFYGCDKLTSLVVPAATYKESLVSSNVSDNIYSDTVMDSWYQYGSEKVSSYLYREGDHYWRVEKSGPVFVEKYNDKFELIEAFSLETDILKKWGGFYNGKEYNFIIYGENNPEDSDKTPVIVIDKYSKDWKKLKSLTIKGFNTHETLARGAVRCAESGKYLYIHASHTMYADSDGIHHQANFTVEIDMDKMKVMDYFDTPKMYYHGGAVSHSFNQFILIDSDKNIITLDHGDASPRSIALFKNGTKAGKSTFTSEKGTMLDIYEIPEYKGTESTGYNKTGTSVGGLEETKNHYVTAYATDGQGGNAGYDGVKNVFVTFTPKKDFTVKATKTIQITSYGSKGNKRAGTPQIVSMGKSGGYILWDIIENGKVSGKIGYVKYTSKGKISKVKTTSGYLSDCKPIYADKQVIWYVTNDSKPVIYTLTKKGVTKKQLK